MKTIKELREFKLNISSRNLLLCSIKSLPNKPLDFDVFLPSKGINLQRDKVWNLQQKRELIISIFMDRPIPVFSIMAICDPKDKTDSIYQVIDGKQRLCTYLDFLNNEFDVMLEGQGYYFDELPNDYKNCFLHKEVICQIIYEDYYIPISDEDKILWFKLLNYAGTPQDEEHIKKLGHYI